jgi:hypothetical protein
VEKGSKLQKIKDDNCLMRFEFIDVCLRIAINKICKVEEGVSPAQAFDLFIEQVLLPNTNPAARVDRDTFRINRLYNEDMDNLLRGHVVSGQILSREGDPKGWSTVLVTAVCSWEKTVPRGHRSYQTLLKTK